MRPRIASPVWALPGAFVLVFALGAAPVGDAGDQEPVVHKVKISVDPDTGVFSYSLDPVEAAPRDHIEWWSEDGGFSVHFIEKTPLAKKSLRGRKKVRVRRPVRANAAAGEYKYFVAVAVDGDVFTDDPKVIVGPRD